MRLLTKFTLIFVLVFGLALPPACVFSYRFLQQNARSEVSQQARLMLESALSIRRYTSAEVRPALDTPEMRQTTFLPQTIPAYAATRSLQGLGPDYREYIYKEAALNPTNPRNRAVDWETDIINEFRRHPERQEQIGERSTSTGKSLFIARAIRAQAPCLECHSTPENAPPSMTRIYGRSRGFGWQPNEIVGAQIISVPMAVPESIARQAFYNVKLCLASFAVLTILILDLVVYITVVKPVSRLSQIANEISNGSENQPMAPASGNDEIADLTRAFNRMHISLRKAMTMLGG
jgi:HAMP domain-containing protein